MHKAFRRYFYIIKWNFYKFWKKLKVLIYTKDNCIWCDRAKILLDSKKISYNEIDLSDDNERLKFYEKIGDNVKTVPQVFIDDKRIGGFQDLKVFLDE